MESNATTTRFHRPDPTKSVPRAKLEDRLRAGTVGETITNAELATIIGCDPRSTKGYRLTATAINFVAKYHGRTWGRMLREGYIQCLDPKQIDGVAQSSRRRVRRIATTAVFKIGNADLKLADDATKQSLLSHAVAFGVIAAQATSPKEFKAAVPANALDMKSLIASVRPG